MPLALPGSASSVSASPFLCFCLDLGSCFTLSLAMSSCTGEDLGFLLGFFGTESVSLRSFSFAFSNSVFSFSSSSWCEISSASESSASASESSVADLPFAPLFFLTSALARSWVFFAAGRGRSGFSCEFSFYFYHSLLSRLIFFLDLSFSVFVATVL